MKGLPLAYNKDMQEDKELVFDALTTTKGCLQLLNDMLKSTTFNKQKMRKSATGGFTNKDHQSLKAEQYIHGLKDR